MQVPVGRPSRRREERNLVTELDRSPGRNRQVSASVWGHQELHGSTTPKCAQRKFIKPFITQDPQTKISGLL